MLVSWLSLLQFNCKPQLSPHGAYLIMVHLLVIIYQSWHDRDTLDAEVAIRTSWTMVWFTSSETLAFDMGLLVQGHGNDGRSYPYKGEIASENTTASLPA